MKNKLFLTSFMVMSFWAPAIAEEFPQDGLMQENKTYDNAAISTNMDGVYEGEVDANAEFVYDIVAGTYLPASSDETVSCLAGSFCPGLSQYVNYSEDSAQGIESCPNGFGNSATGASANTQCYRTCDINNMGANGTIASIAHAASLTGNDYYGNGIDTCEPASCVNGWHVKANVPDLNTLIGQTASHSTVRVTNDGQFAEDSSVSDGDDEIRTYALALGLNANNHNSFAADFEDKGILYGYGYCSQQSGDNNNLTWTNPTTLSSLTDETGQTGATNCWCKIDGYKPSGGTLQNISGSWLFVIDSESVSVCTDECLRTCEAVWTEVHDSTVLAFRAALLGSIQSGPATCEANTINITWNDASAEDIAATGAATTVYEGDIKTPLKAVTKPGKTFRGWKFVKPSQQSGD